MCADEIVYRLIVFLAGVGFGAGIQFFRARRRIAALKKEIQGFRGYGDMDIKVVAVPQNRRSYGRSSDVVTFFNARHVDSGGSATIGTSGVRLGNGHHGAW